MPEDDFDLAEVLSRALAAIEASPQGLIVVASMDVEPGVIAAIEQMYPQVTVQRSRLAPEQTVLVMREIPLVIDPGWLYEDEGWLDEDEDYGDDS